MMRITVERPGDLQQPACYRFGEFTLDLSSFRLRRGTADVPLTPKAFELLCLLVRERQRVLTKQELFDLVWPETAVTENTLTQRVKEIREALGDRAQDPRYVRSIPRVGFQFIAAVAVETPDEPAGTRKESSLADTAPPAESAAGDLESPPIQGAGASRTARRASSAVLAVGGLVAAGVFLLGGWLPPRTPAALGPDRRVMLAILPFENLSGDPEQGYLGDGLTEELIVGRQWPTMEALTPEPSPHATADPHHS
jgi:DNA-binding winged helix-turn-helix (wHTH) protein